MQIYTRYKAARNRPDWRTLLQLAVALAGLGFAGWVIFRTAPGDHDPAPPPPPNPAPAPSSTTSPPVALRSPLPPPTPSPTPIARPSGATPGASNAPGSGARREPFVPPPVPALPSPFTPRPATTLLEAQVALAQRGFSSGSLDGSLGSQTRAALRAFQRSVGLPVSGGLDAATRARLILNAPPLGTCTVQPEDVARLLPVSSSWLGKSRQPRLDFSTVLELVAEEHRTHPALLRQLNPGVDWTNAAPGLTVQVPKVPAPAIAGRLAFLRINLQDRALSGYDARTNLLLHVPCSIASRIEKRPLGRLGVVAVAISPSYTFNPAIFPESAEARRLKRKLTLPPGPNNPVGVAWIGLDRPGYGIHGTPRPEDVGRTESHGCFRLANWDAAWLARLVWPGLPVWVAP